MFERLVAVVLKVLAISGSTFFLHWARFGGGVDV
jgi:hypothetical protein